MSSQPHNRLPTAAGLTRRQWLQVLGSACLGATVGGLGCKRQEARRAVAVWHIWPESDGQPVREVMQRFTQLHPEIDLQAQSVSTNNLKAKLLGAARSNSLPEVFAINSAWVPELHAGESLVDLRPMLQRAGIDPKQHFVEADLERCRTGDAFYCLPATSSRGTSMLFINGELLARIGLRHPPRINNWEEFTEASAEYVAKINRPNDLQFIALDPFMGPGMVIHSSLANGVGAPTISRDGRKSQLNTPASLRVGRALDAYVERVYGPFGGYRALLEWRFRFAGMHRQPAFSSLPYDRQIFAIAAAGSLARYRRILPMSSLTIQPVPGLDRLHGGMASHNWSYCLSRHAASLDSAWELIQYLTTEEEGVGRFCRLYGRPSPLLNISASAYREIWGAAWDGVLEAAALDTVYPASSEDEFLRYHMFLIPMRRLRGERVEDIYAELDIQYQNYLDSNTG